MGFKFSSLVQLLEDLERNRFRKASSAARSVNPDHQIIIAWFNGHDTKIKRNQDEGVAFLSCLFPERRPDRCFHMQETRLASVFGRVYQLGIGRLNELRAWKERKPADFASCLASVLAQTEMPTPKAGNEVTLEEINDALDKIAANVKSSAPALKVKATPFDTVEILTPVLCRLQSIEAKWLVRMLLKSYHPVQIPEHVTMQQFHFMLPDLLAIQNDFGAAVSILGHAELAQLPHRVSKADATVLKTRLAGHLVPKLGVMIKRQEYYKARSIKHCCQMTDLKIMSVEQKYDGEYCQIHIDLSKKPSEHIQIFSKSGRDSTRDRRNLHLAIETSLNLKTRSQPCKIKDSCILEGELLIWNRTTELIQPFHKIRKYVEHGGRFLDNENDSPVGFDEQVMIMYYDVLLWDHMNCLEMPQEERRRVLERLIMKRKGLAEIGVRDIIDFRSRKAPEQLRGIFANGITCRLEGFVLKSCKDPYYSYTSKVTGIKLKKDYISRLADIADLSLVGARLDPKSQRDLGHGDVKWNSFHMASLENKADVQRFDAKPTFKVIGEVFFMAKHDMEYLNTHGPLTAMPFSTDNEFLDVEINFKQVNPPEVLFKRPFVVEVLGSGYERAPNATYWMLRHPRLHKLHTDRAITETVGFGELQDMAKTAQTVPLDAASQEDLEWIKKLESADPKSKKIMDRSQSTGTTPSRSPGSNTTASLTPLGSSQKGLPSAIWSEASLSPEIANKFFSQEDISPASMSRPSSTKRNLTLEHKEVHGTSKERRTNYGKTPTRTTRPALNSLPLTRRTSFTSFQTVLVASNLTLKKMPPWYKPASLHGSEASSPFEPPAVFRSSPGKCKGQGHPSDSSRGDAARGPSREPLTEVANSTRARKPPLGVFKGPNISPDKGIAIPDHPPRIFQAVSAVPTSSPSTIPEDVGVNQTSGAKRPELLPLPTPPSTEEEARKVGPSLQLPEQAGAGTERETVTADSKTAPIGPMSHNPQLPPLLLTPLLKKLSRSSAAALSDLLHMTSVSFTYSHSHFISRFVHHQSTVLIALIDLAAPPHKIADEIRNIMDRLRGLEIKDGHDRRDKGKLLFLDWTFLAVLGGDRDVDEALRSSRKYAAGCLICSRSEGQKRLDVRECFDWKEIIKNV